MKRAVVLVVCLFTLAACGKKDRFKPTAVIDEVDPGYGVTGRTMEVTVRGDFTKWTNITPADVSFGDGVTVDDVVINNQEVIRATITVDAAAAVGSRDVMVGKQTSAGAFEIVLPLEIVSNNAQPGHLVEIVINGVDTEWAPGATTVFFTPPGGALVGEGNIVVEGTPPFFADVPLGVTVLDASTLQVLAYTDLFAPAGDYSVTVTGPKHTDTVDGLMTVDPMAVVDVPTSAGVLENFVGSVADVEIFRFTATDALAQLLPNFPLGGDATQFTFFTDESVTSGGLTIPQAQFSFITAGSIPLPRFVSSTGNDAYLVIGNAAKLAEKYGFSFPTELGGDVDELPYDFSYADIPAALQSLNAGENVAAVSLLAGEQDTYEGTATGWSVSTTTMSPTTANMSFLFTLGSALGSTAVTAGNTGTLKRLVPPRATGAFVQVSNSSGTDGTYDLDWTEAAPPGDFYEWTDGPMVIPPGDFADPFVIPSYTATELEVTGTVNLAELNLYVDVQAAGCVLGALELDLVGPDGYTQTFAVPCEGMAESFGTANSAWTTLDTLDVGFLGSPAGGTWTLRFRNGSRLPAVLNGWGLAIQPL